MKILVFGAGAVGGYLGGLLAHAGYDVTFVARGQAAEAIQKHGLTIMVEKQQFASQPKVVKSFRQAMMDDTPYDLFLVCMKSYDVAAAINEMVAFCPSPPDIITMQNGIGIEEMFINEFGAKKVTAGSLTTPLNHEAYRTIIVERSDRGLALAPTEPGQSIVRWLNLFTGVGLDVVGIDDYRAMKWSKALVNMIGNATSAILNRHPRKIYDYQPTYKLERDMLRETAAVMKGLKLKGVDLPGVTTNRLIFAIKWLPNGIVQSNLAKIVASGRGNKLPSFHLDLVSGKSENEVTYHNGTVAKIGESLGIYTPVNAALNDILMQLVHKEVNYSLYDGIPNRLVSEVNRYRREAKLRKKLDKKNKKKKKKEKK